MGKKQAKKKIKKPPFNPSPVRNITEKKGGTKKEIQTRREQEKKT